MVNKSNSYNIAYNDLKPDPEMNQQPSSNSHDVNFQF